MAVNPGASRVGKVNQGAAIVNLVERPKKGAEVRSPKSGVRSQESGGAEWKAARRGKMKIQGFSRGPTVTTYDDRQGRNPRIHSATSELLTPDSCARLIDSQRRLQISQDL